jgi:hypothetical protein
MPTTPYASRSDLQKIQSQWTKLSGLHTREEWSAAIVRAATGAELAATFAIRQEFAVRSTFDSAFVDSLLRWANGLAGKIDRLLIPLSAGGDKHEAMRALRPSSERINAIRNRVAHQGEFCNEDEAKAVIEQSREFILGLVRMYEPAFELASKKRERRAIAASHPDGHQ